ncbi:protein kinase domain-containing protein [Actinomadura rupiterrae]|uniref:protein kinase domain-containing protein n=1 Tax=Actinomadura rupiterrae TaxID=559627 RepID=UPI0020A447CE|nr:protein kinase [Actinomadura rupiterrae]MCP2342087.1 excisionase family DNA binding protein [Actinomadura rupiterrae]
MSGRLIGDRYRLERRSETSALADAWLARDEAAGGAPVTITLLARRHVWAATRAFNDETDVLRLCRSSRVVKVLDTGITRSGRPYRVTEQVVPAEWPRTDGEGDAVEVLRRAEAAVRAVAAVHRAGFGLLALEDGQFVRRPGDDLPVLRDLGLATAVSPNASPTAVTWPTADGWPTADASATAAEPPSASASPTVDEWPPSGASVRAGQVTRADGGWFRATPELVRGNLGMAWQLANRWLGTLDSTDFPSRRIWEQTSTAMNAPLRDERRPAEQFADVLASARGDRRARLRALRRAAGDWSLVAAFIAGLILLAPVALVLVAAFLVAAPLLLALLSCVAVTGWALRWVMRALWRLVRRRRAEPARPSDPFLGDWFSPEWGSTSYAGPGEPPVVPLHEDFRYVHEPLWESRPGLPDLGHTQLTEALRERITYSRGGTFLITGFRGVGKTTMVQRALAALADHPPEGRRVLPVVLSVARPMSTAHLLFAIVRRVFEALNETGEFDRLPEATRQSLLLTYMRTSLSFKETRSNATEHGASAEVGLSAAGLKALGAAGLSLPKVGMSAKRTRSLATEAAFLAYSETDVEHDMMRIVRMLSAARPGARRRFVPLRRRAEPPLSLVVVLDEVDKLTAAKKGMAALERLLAGMKNVISMPGAYYVVVAGPDLQDRVLLDIGRGNGVYESVFAWRLYVPCSWPAARTLVNGLIVGGDDAPLHEPLRRLSLYLTYKSRGVLRKLLQETHAFVSWQDGRPYLRFSPEDWERVSFYADLERTLQGFFDASADRVFPSEIDQDRWRLGAHYVTDWVLRSEGLPFTAADIQKAEADGDFDAELRIRPAAVELLLEHLMEAGLLTVVRKVSASATFLADVAEAKLTSYRLTDAARRHLRVVANATPDERAELNVTLSPQMRSGATVVPEAAGAADVTGLFGRPAPPPVGAGHGLRTLDDRYELRRLIGEGGMSTVYEGYDTLLRRTVAVKQLRSSVADDRQARERFRREAEITRGLRHPNVVAVHDIVTEGAAVSIVMEYLDGPSLAEALADAPPSGPFPGPRGMPAHEVVRIGVTLAGTLQYLSEQGLARLDVKPGNIILIPGRGPVIIDLGIAKAVAALNQNQLTQTGVIIGTPLYMAPEQIDGERVVDIRADVFALGMVLLTCLLGAHPLASEAPLTVLSRIVERTMDVSALTVSPPLRTVLAKALHRDPAERYQSPGDLARALTGTPEAGDPGTTRLDADRRNSFADEPSRMVLADPIPHPPTRLDARPLNGSVTDEVLSTSELADRLGMSPRKIRQMAKDGLLPAQRQGNAYRFSWRDVEQTLNPDRA